MKNVKTLSTGKRIVRNLAFFILSALIGFIAGFVAFAINQNGWPDFLNLQLLMAGSRILCLTLILITLYFMFQANRYHKIHQAFENLDEIDDDDSYDSYCMTFRNLEFATSSYNIFIGLAMFLLFSNIPNLLTALSEGAFEWTFLSIDILVMLAVWVLQVMILKLTQKIRNYKLSAMPTIEEMKQFAYSYDEGELQANYEQSFLIVFNLAQRVLPIIYLVLLVLAMVTPFNMISGFIVTLAINTYLHIAGLPFINKYYRK